MSFFAARLFLATKLFLATIGEVRWRLFDWQLLAESRAGKLAHEQLDQVRIAKLRKILRHIPYWSAGHLRLAEESFQSNDITASFVSTQAVLALESYGSRSRKARAIQARCFLKRGAVIEAREIVASLLKEEPNSNELREDLGAILILEQSFNAAVTELEKIPRERLTGEGLAALQFARSKASARPQCQTED